MANYTLGTVVDTAGVASSTTITAAPTFSAHDEAFAYLTYGNGVATSEVMADTALNVWSKIGSTISDATNSQSSALFYCKDCAAGTPTVTGTFVGAQVYRGLWIIPVQNLDNTTTPVGGGQLQSAPGTGANAVTSGNITPPAQPGIFGGFTFDSSASNPVISAGTGFGSSASAANITSVMGLTTLREDTRITSTSAKAATFTPSIGTGNFLTLAFTAPEGGGAPAHSRIGAAFLFYGQSAAFGATPQGSH
jgi:hypothetical protein